VEAPQWASSDAASLIQPRALAYAGHQFGHFTMLGDGRAILLGEYSKLDGTTVDVQLKGSGRTPFSRGGDGRATLSSMVREFLISEAMHFLGIPTTRSLAVVFTGEGVAREEMNPGAILTRVARSHIRVGTFEYIYQYQSPGEVKIFTDYVIDRLYPDCRDSVNPALALLDAIIQGQVKLIVDWLRVGFIHGVMNTDNMSISCETIDYGPCAFMNSYDPLTVFSSIDRNGRYAFENQVPIAHWNLSCLANSLLPAIHEDLTQAIELAKNSLNQFVDIFQKEKNTMLGNKIGILDPAPENLLLVNELFEWMKEQKVDYTNTFLYLESQLNNKDSHTSQESMDVSWNKIYSDEHFIRWLEKWKQRRSELGLQNSDCISIMQKTNPSIIPRNHIVEEALENANQNDWNAVENLWKMIRSPYENRFPNTLYHFPPEDGDGNYKTFCGT
ncbi:MAG: YdiU family protein, partial [Leptospira sp.]|nr:YdiU family protein [Leptospira sp.]